jgi:hypothetical protein
MKVTLIKCDLCDDEIVSPEKPFVVKTGEGNQWKKVGCDFVLTPKGNRVHARDGSAMIRMNASFYCGSYASGMDELHFHTECIDTEVRKRVIEFYGEKS